MSIHFVNAEGESGILLNGCEVNVGLGDMQVLGTVVHAEGRMLRFTDDVDEDDDGEPEFFGDDWYYASIRHALPVSADHLDLIAVVVESTDVPTLPRPMPVSVPIRHSENDQGLRDALARFKAVPSDYPAEGTTMDLYAIHRRASKGGTGDETLLVLCRVGEDGGGE